MDRTKTFALDAAKEITVSRVSNTNLCINKDGGEDVADFYEAIFKKVYELAKDETT